MKEEELVEKIERLEQKISRLERAVGRSSSANRGNLLRKKVLIPVSMLSFIIVATVVFATTIPKTFTSGTIISSSDVNSNFSYIISRLWDATDSSSDLYYTAGKIGIGTTSPTKTLDVSGDVAILGILGVTGDTTIFGKVGIGTDNPTEALDISGDSIRIRTAKTSAVGDGDTCNQGEISWDVDYIYVCTSPNVWKKTILCPLGGCSGWGTIEG